VITGHAYPWDVLGDPAFPDRVRAHGIETVALAAAYHSVRAATPLHPRHQVVTAAHAALYRPVRADVWRGRLLRPAEPTWMSTSDSFGAAAERLRAAGLRVSAWVVLTHNTRLGTEFPDLAVVNCFGDRYSYALCPSRPQVREYAALLAAEAAAGADAVSLEACGQLGLTHGSHHEKTDDAWTPAAARWLSVCCCAGCRTGWAAQGLDPDEVVGRLRAAVAGAELPAAEEVLVVRQHFTDLLRAQVLAALPDVPVTLHAHPDPWATGASAGLTPTAAEQVAALLVPAWPTHSSTAVEVGRAVATGRSTEAYVTVLSPSTEDSLRAHVRRLADAGAAGLAVYHLGLAAPWRQSLITAAVREFTGT
jgi:hypothetical protein